MSHILSCFTFSLKTSFSHFSHVHRLMNVNHLEPQVIDANLLLVIVIFQAVAVLVFLVVVCLEAVDAVWRGDLNAFGKV